MIPRNFGETVKGAAGNAGQQAGTPTIRHGSQGLGVAYLQNLLNARIPSPVTWVDGIFGPLTDSKVRQFQTMKRLAVDGIVGPMTWNALETGPPRISKRF